MVPKDLQGNFKQNAKLAKLPTSFFAFSGRHFDDGSNWSLGKLAARVELKFGSPKRSALQSLTRSLSIPRVLGTNLKALLPIQPPTHFHLGAAAVSLRLDLSLKSARKWQPQWGGGRKRCITGTSCCRHSRPFHPSFDPRARGATFPGIRAHRYCKTILLYVCILVEQTRKTPF